MAQEIFRFQGPRKRSSNSCARRALVGAPHRHSSDCSSPGPEIYKRRSQNDFGTSQKVLGSTLRERAPDQKHARAELRTRIGAWKRLMRKADRVRTHRRSESQAAF